MVKVKMYRLLCILTNLVMINTSGYCQNQYNVWYFGDHAGVDFNSGIPVALNNSAMFAFEGCAGICDSSGNIMFYTNGGDLNSYAGGVWNRNNVLMPNGDLNGFSGCQSSDQSSLIIPFPGTTNLFYLFTLDCSEDAFGGGFRYSIIDMNLDAGNGDITIKDTLVENGMSESMCGVVHSNGNDFWVLVHSNSTNEFKAFLVNSSGIQPPVSSLIGPGSCGICQLKANAYGTQICLAACSGSFLFNFNNSTGVVSNQVNLNVNGGFGSSFSPNGNILYLLDGTAFPFKLVQFDLTASNISSTYLVISSLTTYGEGLMLAHDCKIYMPASGTHYLHVISDPDVLGIGCSFTTNAVYLGNSFSKYEPPNNIDGLFASTCLINGYQNQYSQSFTVYPNPAHNFIYIHSNTNNNLKVKISDISGQILSSGIYNNAQLIKININNFESGIYFLIIVEDQIVYTRKLFIE